MEALLEQVREYLPADRVDFVEKAFEFAVEAHRGQMRRSGDPYIHHPVEAARYLANLKLDAPTIAAALLHDVVEDCDVSLVQIRKQFGADVAKLVDGVTKLTRIDTTAVSESPVARSDNQAESLRKMLVAMAEDIRVVLIKLADRLHNMHTLKALPAPRRRAIARETLDIYAPLAHRLGMGEVKWQLEDLSFRYLHPDDYKRVSRLIAVKRTEREAYVERITEALRRELAAAGFSAEVYGRPKHLYSIFRKAQAYENQGKRISEIYDLFALRVLVPTVPECYAALGAVHSLWRPLPGQFDDYIANPKENMYQSLHTCVRAVDGFPVEVQLRTYQMHQVAEYGVASHWSYKEGGATDSRFEERMSWLRQLLDWQRDDTVTADFIENVTTDLFQDQVFVYTPRNEIRELPAGSTPIDFAYSIHTEIGHRCISAKVNGRLVSLRTQLRNGDTVEILTSKVARGPTLDWLNPHLGYVKTANARQAIRAWFRKQNRGVNIERGRDLLKREYRRLNAAEDDAIVARWFNYDSPDDLYAAIGSGLVSITQVAGRLSARQAERDGKRGSRAAAADGQPGAAPIKGVSVLGVGDLLTRMGECCRPIPGDDITGFITRTRGVTIHKNDCPNVRHVSEPERVVPVAWGKPTNLFPVHIRVEAFDRVGLLHDITGATSAERVNLAGTRTEVFSDGSANVHLTAQVSSLEQLSRLFDRIEGVRGVRSVGRAPMPAAPVHA